MSGDHWWWNVPEFVAAQRDPGFRAWVQAIDLGVELGEETFAEIIPGLSVDDPFGDEGIGLAERAFLDAFPDRRAMDADQTLMFRFIKYLGQAYVEKLECRWVWQPAIKGYWDISTPAIERPWPTTDMLFDLIPIMNATVHFRRGDDWFFVFNNNRPDYLEWVAQGRPGFAEWKAHGDQIEAL